MNTTIASGLVIFIVALAFLFIARRILRLALKVAFVLILIFVLLGGATVAWWQGWFSSFSSARTPASQTNQRTNINRRPNQR